MDRWSIIKLRQVWSPSYLQSPGIDYKEIFSPVVCFDLL